MADPRPDRLALDPSVRARTALEYLGLWAQLHQADMHQFGPAAPARGPGRPERASPALLRDGLEAYQAQHPTDPIVTLARDPDITPADLALLHILLLDVQSNPPEQVGLAVVNAASMACGSDNNTQALERLAPGAPLVARGLALVTKAERGLTYGRVAASSELVRLAWAGHERLADGVPDLPAASSSSEDDEGFSFEPRAAPTSVGTRVKPHAGMPFVLPPEARATFEQAVAALQHGARLRAEFGFAETLPTAAGARVLFYGPPGTGKTTACGALAAALGREMLVLHPNDVLDKFVGNSEKRLASAFEAAQRDGLLLVIDEIDAYAYARSEASHTHQRQQVTQLLVLLEKHADLPVAATTNEATSLDPALERRLTFRIHVQRPGTEERARLWDQMLPARLPRAGDVDLGRLAASHEVTGAQIRDAIFQAGIRMLGEGRTTVTMADLESGLQVVQGGRWTEPAHRGPIGFSAR